MKQRSKLMAMFLALASGPAAAGGLNLPSGQQAVTLPNLNTTTSATGTNLPALPATSLPAATPAAASHPVHAATLPGLDGLAEAQGGAHANAIRPIRIPGGGNNIVLPPIPGLTSGSASGS